MLRKTALTAVVLVLCICTGCQTHQQNKAAAQLRWQKASAKIKLRLAEQQFESGQYEQARKNIAECLEADPESAQAHLLFGKLLLARDRGGQAASELLAAVTLDESLAEGWYWLGAAAEQSGRTNQALEYYTKALELDGDETDYVLAVAQSRAASGQPREALSLLNEKMRQKPADVSLKVAAADIMFGNRQYDEAIKLYERAMLLAEDDHDIAQSLGYCYIFAGRPKQAAEIFKSLAERCDNASSDDDGVAAVQERTKKLYLEIAALCSMQSGRYDTAVDCYDKLTVECRNDADVWVKLGQAALGAGLHRRAVMCGQRALTLQPGNAEAMTLIGCARYAGGEYQAAAETFEKLTGRPDCGALSWLMLGRCEEKLGRLSQAEAAYRKALQLQPDSKLGRLLARD